jgi:hypothetical protein
LPFERSFNDPGFKHCFFLYSRFLSR